MSTTTRLEELKHDLAQGAGGERAKPDPPVRRWQRARAAQLTGIGACSDAVLGFFDWETKDYRKIPITEQVEVVSLLGDIALGADASRRLHLHVVVSRDDGIAMGGHLMEAHVRPTLEVVLTESPRHLHKRKDAESGLALIVAEE